MPTIHLLIKGKVQGVFYRATAKKIAQKLEVTGWIKNTKDGNVEAAATGNEEHLKEFINWCKQGPDNAKVEEVIVEQNQKTLFNTFEITR
ncbi:MAG: acylphosphatase [Chitinophagaceae bacterium]|nr:acylphosphatase [Chitinophagaceae bacterium]